MNQFPHYGTFQKSVTVKNEGGGSGTTSWQNVISTECHVQPLGGQEYMQAQQLQAPIDHKIFYPYQEGVNASMRFVWHDRDDKVIDLQSNPKDEGGLGEIMRVMGEMDGS